MPSSIFGFALFFLACAPLSWAEPPVTASETVGYVVRVDSRGVFLDLGEGSGASIGQIFEIYTEGEELTHPVTGKSLGRIKIAVTKGTIREIAPLYSIGNFRAGRSAPACAPAWSRTRYDSSPPASPSASPHTGRTPRWKSPPFDFEIADFAVADFDGTGGLKVAVASSRSIFLFPYPPVNAKPIAQVDIPGIAPKILSIEAEDLNADGRAELFVSFYSATLGRVETLVFELAIRNVEA